MGEGEWEIFWLSGGEAALFGNAHSKVLEACLGAVGNTHLIKLSLLLLRIHIHSKKASQYFKSLKHYLKAPYSNVKAL